MEKGKVTFVIEAYIDWDGEDPSSFWQEVVPDEWLANGYSDKLRQSNIGEMFEKMVDDIEKDKYWGDKVFIERNNR